MGSQGSAGRATLGWRAERRWRMRRPCCGKAPDPACILQSSRVNGRDVSPIKALACTLLNKAHELFTTIFPIPFAASAFPAREKVPVRGGGGRVGNPGLVVYGDFRTGPRDRPGSHFRAYGDDLRGPRKWGGNVTFVQWGSGNGNAAWPSRRCWRWRRSPVDTDGGI